MAQQDFLYFKIQAEDNQEPIAIAKVNAYCANKFTQFSSDSNGNVTVPMAFKNCMFSLEAAGYDTKYNIEVGATKFITIVLERRNTQLQDIVVTGQAKHVLAEKSIYKINVINAATLRQQAANNLGDALATQNNFFKQNDNILGSSINMQGIGGQNIKILLNGVPMNGRENGNIDISQINVANVERIEIIKGPMSVLYGTDALGGVINIITKTNTDNKRLELQAYAESNNKINNNISFGMAKKRHSFSTNIARNFFGVINLAGISAISISQTLIDGGFEVDHLQYGFFSQSSQPVSEPSTVFGLLGFGLFGLGVFCKRTVSANWI
jgi:outer membrane receptor for ferrienterochelin and colicins